MSASPSGAEHRTDADAGGPVVWLEEVDSTNRRLVAAARTEPERWRGRVLAARIQTAGRGRRGRAWISTPGANLTCSLCRAVARPVREWPTLAQTAALAVYAFLHDTGLDGVSVKWPNDVLVRDRKICGILAEPAPPAGLVIGIGLNVNMTSEEANALDQPATSLRIETGRTFAVETILDGLLPGLTASLDQWDREGFEGLHNDYLSAAGGLGAKVRIREDDRHLEGRIAGLAADGALELQLDDGTRRAVYSGDLDFLPPT